MKRLCTLLMTLAVVGTLSGCMTTRGIQGQLNVSSEKMAEAQHYVDTTTKSLQTVYRLSQAMADVCMNDKYRAPFSLLYNWPWIKDEELRTGIFRLSGANEYPVVLAHTRELQKVNGKRLKELNGADTGKIVKTFSKLLLDSDENEELKLIFEDGQELTVKPVRICASYVVPGYMSKRTEPINRGTQGEDIPQDWVDLPKDANELAFVLGRSVYFTGAEGRDKLSNAYLLGAAPNGVLRAVTLGFSGLVVDMKDVVVNVRRKANRPDADAFSVKAMVAAGYDPNSALAFAARSMKAKDWPEAGAELKFDEERYAQLEQAVKTELAALSAKVPPLAIKGDLTDKEAEPIAVTTGVVQAQMPEQYPLGQVAPLEPLSSEQMRAVQVQTRQETTIVAGTTRYVGLFQQDENATTVSGTGKVVWDNGDQYEGEVVRGLRQGSGKFQWANGQRYAGVWKNDLPHGEGVFHFPDGARYEGAVLDGAPNGSGRIEFASGDMYSGDVRNGVPHGRGTYLWKTGDRWTGIFQDGKQTETGQLQRVAVR